MTRRAAKQPKQSKRPPDAVETEHAKGALDRLRNLPLRIDVEMTDGKIDAPHSDPDGHLVSLMELLGSRSAHFMGANLGSLEASSRSRTEKRGDSNTGFNAALALVQAIAPKDELEAAMAVQMTAVHCLAAELLGRAKTCDRTDHIALYGNLAVKLTRTFSMQVEALAKMRGGGKQQVEVRHVYVNGNAVIGNVQQGGGSATEIAQQPHAPYLERRSESVSKPFA